MANATVTRVGQVNGAGDVDALFLKVFAGEVITAFDAENVTLGKTQVRAIQNGKSAQFPRTGITTASYHTPGTEIVGKTMNHGEVVITIDDLLLSDAFIASIDEAKNHYDVRSIYTTEIGRALAKQMDKHVLQVGVLAARGSNVVTGLPGGSVITPATSGAPGSANFLTNGDHIAEALFLAAQALDEKDVPEDGRYAYFKPAQYYALAKSTKVLNKDWNGSGSYAEGSVIKVAGISIVKTNNLPVADVANGTVAAGTGNRYAGTFATTCGLVMHGSAVGTVKLMDLAMDSAYDIRRQGTLMVAKYSVGHGILRPECAVEIKSA